MVQYIGENKVDVVCLGSSHVYTGINPIQLYEEHGIAGYDIAGGSRAPWQDYYYLKAVDKHQNPTLVILDVYVYSKDSIGDFNEGRAIANLLNYPLSVDKYKALMASDVSDPISVMLKFPYRYDEYEKYRGLSLSKADKEPYCLMGYSYLTGVEEYTNPIDGKFVKEAKPIHPKIEEYLRKSIEYCKTNNIDMLLTNTPSPAIDEERYMYYNYIEQIANEYGVSFINGCLHMDEMGMDWEKDSYGDGGHLNYDGVTKYTSWLGEYLTNCYDIPDHRGESGYEMYGIAVKELDKKISER